jgi:indole-3-glycerol phosphate synthase
MLSASIPDTYVKVSESGLSTIEAIQELQSYGYKGFLIGEQFMKSEDPGKSAAAFINKLA